MKLDDVELVAKIAPELGRAKVLEGFDGNDKPILREKKVGITLRHLLSHTGMFFVFCSSTWLWVRIAGFGGFGGFGGCESSGVYQQMLTRNSWFRIHVFQSRDQEARFSSWPRRVLWSD